ncbi:MAG: hypothetical protein AAF664_01705 [Planctomycetota bacterium]
MNQQNESRWMLPLDKRNIIRRHLLHHRGCLPVPMGDSGESMPRIPVAFRVAIDFASKTELWEGIERLILPPLDHSSINAWERVSLGIRRALYVLAVSLVFKMLEFGIAPTLVDLASDFPSESNELISPSLDAPSALATFGLFLAIALVLASIRETRRQIHALSVEHFQDIVDVAVDEGFSIKEATETLSGVLREEVSKPRSRAIVGLQKRFESFFKNDILVGRESGADDRVTMWVMRQRSIAALRFQPLFSPFGILMVLSQVYVVVLVGLTSVSIFKFLADVIRLEV